MKLPWFIIGLLFLLSGCGYRGGSDYAKEGDDIVPTTVSLLPPPQIVGEDRGMQRELPPTVPEPQRTATVVPERIEERPDTILFHAPPEILTLVQESINQLGLEQSDYRWVQSAEQGGANIWLQMGRQGFLAGETPIVLSVPFTAGWHNLSLEEATGIVSEGHPVIMVENWSDKPVDRRALRIEGKLPFEAGYALTKSWSMGAEPGYEEAALLLSNEIQAASLTTEVVHLAFVGDISLDRRLGGAIVAGNIDYPFAEVVEALSKADITIGNLESALGSGGTPARKSYTFLAPPESVDSLRRAGFDILSLANNHALDYGETTLVEGIRLLSENGIAPIGAGETDSEARNPYIVDANGLRIGFLAYVNVPVEFKGFDTAIWKATDTRPGLAWAEPGTVQDDVRSLRDQVDIVIVIIHSGHEYVEEPSPQQRLVSEAAVASGADLVVGHHAHLLQGVRFIEGKVIAYGLGNFAFDITGDPSSAILNVWLDKGGVRQLEFMPVVLQPGGRPAMADETAASEIRNHIYHLTTLLNPQN